MPPSAALARSAEPLTDEGLVRALGPSSVVLFVLGSVIGSGIFLTTGRMAATLPSAPLILAAWLAGGVVILCGGLTYAELGAMFPRSGGVYVYLREAFGPLVAFLYGWAAFLVFWSGGIAAVSVGFADYFSYFVPALGTARILATVPTPVGVWQLSAAQLVAVACISVLAAINYVGVRSGNAVNIVLTVAKVAGLASLPLLVLAAGGTAPQWSPVVPPVERPLAGFGVIMIAVLWTNDAWYCVTWIAGEVRQPQRTLPRGLLAGILCLTAIYAVVNLAYLYALPMDVLAGTSRVAEAAAARLAGSRGATFVALTVVVSTLGCNVAAILAGARLLFAMARDGVFLRAAARVHPRYHTPHVATIALCAWASVLALSGTYEQLFTYVVFASLLLQTIGVLAVFRLRRTRPEAPRPYKTWGYPVVPAIFVCVSSVIVLNTLLERPTEALVGLGLLALGLPVYWYSKR